LAYEQKSLYAVHNGLRVLKRQLVEKYMETKRTRTREKDNKEK